MSGRRNKLISLFCGPGGFDQGFKDAGFETLLAVDKDPVAVETHRYNHKEAEALALDLTEPWVAKFIGDQWQVRCSTEPPVGIIGGPPCQSFSVGNSYKKKDDPRDDLPLVYTNLIDILNKRFKKQIEFFVFENVPALKTNHSAKYKEFKKKAEEIGFCTFEKELDAKDFGVPQVRKRMFVVGINKIRHKDYWKKLKSFEFPKGQGGIISCGSILDNVMHEAVIANSGLIADEIREVAGHWNHWCMAPVSDKFRCKIIEKQYNSKKYRIAIKETAQYPDETLEMDRLMGGKSFKILNPTKPSYTIAYGHREVHIHPDRHRRLSVFEAMLLQGFTKDYRFIGTISNQIKMVSEVVAPPVACALANAIKEQLDLKDT